MKLRNKKTGEIIETDFELSISIPDDEKLYGNDTYTQIKGYNSIKELSEEWEDYEEPKQSALRVMILTLANFIENEPSDNVDLEDCKDMLKRLEAWQRLKDKGFKFLGIKEDYTRIPVLHRDGRRYLLFNKSEDEVWLKENWKDLFLLFGGEE